MPSCCRSRNLQRAAVMGLLSAALPVLTGCLPRHQEQPAAAQPERPAPAARSVPRFRDVAQQLGIHFVRDNGGSGRCYYPEFAGGGGALGGGAAPTLTPSPDGSGGAMTGRVAAGPGADVTPTAAGSYSSS